MNTRLHTARIKIKVLIFLSTILFLSAGVPFLNVQNLDEKLSTKFRETRSLSLQDDQFENSTPDNAIDSEPYPVVTDKVDNQRENSTGNSRILKTQSSDISEEIENKFRHLKELQGRKKLGTLPIDASPEKYEMPEKSYRKGRFFKGRSFANQTENQPAQNTTSEPEATKNLTNIDSPDNSTSNSSQSRLTPEELELRCNRTFINVESDDYNDDEFNASMCNELKSTTTSAITLPSTTSINPTSTSVPLIPHNDIQSPINSTDTISTSATYSVSSTSESNFETTTSSNTDNTDNSTSLNCTDKIFLDLEDDSSSNGESQLPICPEESTAVTEDEGLRTSSHHDKIFIDLSTAVTEDEGLRTSTHHDKIYIDLSTAVTKDEGLRTSSHHDKIYIDLSTPESSTETTSEYSTSPTVPISTSSTGSETETSACPDCSTNEKVYIDLQPTGSSDSDEVTNDDDAPSTSPLPAVSPTSKTRTRKTTKKSKKPALYTESVESDYVDEPYFFDYLTEYYLHGGLRGRSGYCCK